jgi:hypothetical protein
VKNQNWLDLFSFFKARWKVIGTSDVNDIEGHLNEVTGSGSFTDFIGKLAVFDQSPLGIQVEVVIACARGVRFVTPVLARRAPNEPWDSDLNELRGQLLNVNKGDLVSVSGTIYLDGSLGHPSPNYMFEGVTQYYARITSITKK